MRIELDDATGCPVPQFVVYPETEADRMLLKAFFSFLNDGRGGWEFALHGPTWCNGRVQAFNFGLRKKWVDTPLEEA